MYAYGPFAPLLNESKLSNHLGINGMVITSDKKVVFVKRSNKVSIGKGTWGIGVGASCKSQYALTVDNKNIDNTHQFTLDGLRKAIVHEAMDELKLLPEQIGEFDLVKHLLVFYLDLIEGGKPQLLFYMPVTVDFESLNRHFQDELQKKTEREAIRHSNFNKMKTDGSELDFISIDQLMNHTSVYMTEVVVDEDGRKKSYAAFPTLSACVGIFIQKLREGVIEL